MQPHAFMFMGRPGAGKGTQAQLLIETLAKKDPNRKVIHIETGAEFRKFNEGPSYTSKLGKQIVDTGGLMPVFMTVYLWGSALVERFTGQEHLIFDGTPRKLLEAQLVEGVFPFYGIKADLIYLDVHHDESKKRLLLRGKLQGRKDDAEEAIERRKIAYDKEVHPTVEYFRTHHLVKFHDIDGIGTIPEVHARILKSLGLE